MFFDGEEIKDLPLRTKYIVGPAGPTGNQGENGVGVITGGTTGQVLAKKSNADYDTEWVNQSGGGGGSGVVTWGAITGLLSNQTDLQDALNLKAPSTNIPASSITGLATVATSGSYNDLLNKPTIPNAQVNSDWSSITGISQILNKPNLAVVATSGSYNDLVDKPTIPSGQVNSDWSSVTGVSQILNKPTLAVVATSGSYTDLSNKPTYSDVGAAPSSGISPSAISGIAVITTDPRLSDSRTPTAHASSHAVGGSDALTASAIAALGLETDSYVIANGGDDLVAKYIQAAALNPNGSLKSATNRATLILMPGNYTFSEYYVMNEEFVDIIGLGSQTKKPSVFIQGTYNSEEDEYFNISFAADNMKVIGVSFINQTLYVGNTVGQSFPLQVFENCVGGNKSFGNGVNASGTYINCVAGDGGFGHTFGATASGTFINCTGGNYCFGSEATASGIFKDCSAGNYSFGGASGGTASGIFEGCIAGTSSFGGTNGTASGTFTNCKSEAGGSFGGTDGTASGVFRNCIAGDSSFGLDGGISNGQFYNCQSIVFRSGAVLTAPTSGFAVQQNCSDDLGNIIDGYATS
jgi:hypothetical protein